MNISIFYVDNRVFTSGKDCIRTFRVRCNIATLDVDLTAVNAEDYCILTTKIAVIIACSVTSFIKYAIFDVYDCFIFTDKSSLIGCCVCHRLMSNRFVFCNDSCAFESIRIYFGLWFHTIRSTVWRCASLCGWCCFGLFCCGYNCYVSTSLSLCG